MASERVGFAPGCAEGALHAWSPVRREEALRDCGFVWEGAGRLVLLCPGRPHLPPWPHPHLTPHAWPPRLPTPWPPPTQGGPGESENEEPGPAPGGTPLCR